MELILVFKVLSYLQQRTGSLCLLVVGTGGCGGNCTRAHTQRIA